jgi:hypothetical protein
MINRLMKGARERGVRDKKIIHEKLPSYVDANNGRRRRQIRRRDGVFRDGRGKLRQPRWPFRRKLDAVIQHFPFLAGKRRLAPRERRQHENAREQFSKYS